MISLFSIFSEYPFNSNNYTLKTFVYLNNGQTSFYHILFGHFGWEACKLARGDVNGRPGPQSSSSLHLSLRKCYQAMLAWLFECEIKESLVYASDFRLTMLSRGLPLLPDFWAMPEINFIFARSSLKLDNISFLRT